LLSISDFPLLKENEAAGDYHVQTLKADFKTAFVISLNPVVKDPVLLEIFNDIRFRQALSIAMDRDALNEAVFFGLATPRQIAPLPSVSFYDDSWSDYMTGYDVDRANDLLDDMGLGWDASHNLRVRSDGKPLNILMESGHGSVMEVTVSEVLKAMWEEIGVTLTINPTKLTPDRLQTGELYEMGICDCGGGSTEMDLQGDEQVFLQNSLGGYSWNTWIRTDGDDGTEPPQEWKDLAVKVERSKTLVPGTDEWVDLKQEIWDWRIKQLWHIGTVYGAPIFDVVGNDLHNVPSGFWFGWAIGFHPLLMTQQWYLDQ
jgi:peptide/nickel transport system substrate-binding protein